MGALRDFYEKWLRTHLGLDGYFVEIGHAGEDMKGFYRNIYRQPGDAADLIERFVTRSKKARNVLASIARYPNPTATRESAVYPVLVLDLDCEGNPEAALTAALEVKAWLRSEYGADSVLVASGFKDAHLHIPLKTPLEYGDYTAIFKALLERAPIPTCNGREMVDPTTATDWRHLIRVPFTFNVKQGRARFAQILDNHLEPISPADFEWGEPLDPRALGVARVEVEAPVIVSLPPWDAGRRGRWIWTVLSTGLPDGRKRFILLTAAPFLLNYLGLPEEEVYRAVVGFIEASCRNHGKCGGVSDSWIRSTLRSVKRRGIKYCGLRCLERVDPELLRLSLHAMQPIASP